MSIITRQKKKRGVILKSKVALPIANNDVFDRKNAHIDDRKRYLFLLVYRNAFVGDQKSSLDQYVFEVAAYPG